MSDVPVELEHVIGLNTDGFESFHVHPNQMTKIVYCAGSTLIIGDLKDPHDQTLLCSHDRPIQTLRLGPKGTRIFTAEKCFGNGQPKLIVWDYDTKKQVVQLAGLQGSITSACFSPDDRFLIAGDEKANLCIWDLQTLHVCAYIRLERPCESVSWGLIGEQRRMPSYTFVTCTSGSVKVHAFDYDVRSLQYQISSSHPMGLPSSGLKRHFKASAVTSDGTELIVGTEAGELIIFNIVNRVFRFSLQVGSKGITASLLAPNSRVGESTVYVGSGDGRIHRVVGRDLLWNVEGVTAVDGAVISLSMSGNVEGHCELTVATANGTVYALDQNLTRRAPISYSHTSAVTSITFPHDSNNSEKFVTGSADGIVRLWDLSDYSIKVLCRVGIRGVAGPVDLGPIHAVMYLERPGQLVAGFASGSLVIFDSSSGEEVFKIPEAHRGGTRCLCCTDSFIISGGADGAVRVWTRKSFSFVAQFTDHNKAVERVFADVSIPGRIHSVGVDRTLVTYDLRAERKISTHMLTAGGPFTCASQRSDQEKEIYTGAADGSIAIWDVDIPDVVSHVKTSFPTRLNDLAFSPNNQFLASAKDNGQITLFDGKRLNALANLSAHSESVSAVAWSPDGKQLVSGAADGCIAIWNVYN